VYVYFCIVDISTVWLNATLCFVDNSVVFLFQCIWWHNIYWCYLQYVVLFIWYVYSKQLYFIVNNTLYAIMYDMCIVNNILYAILYDMSTENTCIVNNILYAILYDLLNIAGDSRSLVWCVYSKQLYCKQYFVRNIVWYVYCKQYFVRNIVWYVYSAVLPYTVSYNIYISHPPTILPNVDVT
jgi:hypothetical protein